MRIAGIICEFNPMHRGHRHLVDEARKKADVIVAALSGPFVQRGEPAFFDKWDRARIAVANGVDLVLELPIAVALQSSDVFAKGAVQLLQSLPLTHLVFGVEEGWTRTQLHHLNRQWQQEETQTAIRQGLARGHSYRKAVSSALQTEFSANNILALSYLKALHGTAIHACPIPRVGASHHEKTLKTNYPSASALRNALRRAPDPTTLLPLLAEHTPPSLLQQRAPRLNDLKGYVDAWLILQSPDWTASPFYEPGMEFRLQKFLLESPSPEDACRQCANKRHTASRYRRYLLSLLLGISERACPEALYLHPLAFNARGAALLRNATLPIVQKPTRRRLSSAQEALFQMDQRAQALYELLRGEERGRDFRACPFLPD